MLAASNTGVQAARVLIVDDERAVCDLIADLVVEDGLDAKCVHGDQAAYDALKEGDFAALVVDVNLGAGTTGFDVARFARQIDPTLPVIYVSGAASDRSFAAFGVPGSSYVPKPFSAEELRQRIGAAVSRRN